MTKERLTTMASRFRGSMGVAATSTLVGLGSVAIALFEFYGTSQVVVATSPPSARVFLDEKEIGTSPVNLALRRGTYTILASHPGYVASQQAVFVSGRTEVVNMQLLPEVSSAGTTRATSQPRPVPLALAALAMDVARLKAAVLANPEDALSLGIINEKLKTQEQLTNALRDDVKGVKEQATWYLGSLIAVIVGLLAVIATLFMGLRGK